MDKKDYDINVEQNQNNEQSEQKSRRLTVLLLIFDLACVLFTIMSNLIQGYNIFYVLFIILTVFCAIAALITANYILSKGNKQISRAGKILSIISLIIIPSILAIIFLIGGLYIAILMFM